MRRASEGVAAGAEGPAPASPAGALTARRTRPAPVRGGTTRTAGAAPPAGPIAAACGPRRGKRVERCTNSGVVAIFGMPLCWCGGGVGRRVISVVVAPGAAWTRVGATGRGACESAGFGTTLALASLPSRATGLDALAAASLVLLAARGGACGTGGELLALLGRQRLILLPARAAVGRRHLTRFLEAQPCLIAFGRGEPGPLGHPRGDPGALLGREGVEAGGERDPLLLARRIDRRPVALERGERLALGRGEALPAHAFLARRGRRGSGGSGALGVGPGGAAQSAAAASTGRRKRHADAKGRARRRGLGSRCIAARLIRWAGPSGTPRSPDRDRR